MISEIDPASFRDPSGFVYRREGTLYRQINRVYAADYDKLMGSGLYENLVGKGALIAHEESPISYAVTDHAVRVIRPQELPFVSYPYEWSFSAFKDAALLTLDIQLAAMNYGMSLKDASAYNVQFDGACPVFIDTLSFKAVGSDEPWVAYNQFCRHFLAPLALMSKTDVGLGQLMRTNLDGIPLELTSKILPWRSRFNIGLLVHIHLLAKMVDRYSETSSAELSSAAKRKRLSPKGLRVLLEGLRRLIAGLTWQPKGTEWVDYYQDNSYDDESFEEKKKIVASYLEQNAPHTVWDLGGNVGTFSRLASMRGCKTVSFDIDPACVEVNYRKASKDRDRDLLPLILDLTNPSPAIGWSSSERMSIGDRGSADMVLALALVHHLAIANNVPFGKIGAFMASITRKLVIEFVPKSDPQVQRLLQSREDIFPWYTKEGFEEAFSSYFTLEQSQSIGTDGRVLYLMTATT